MNKVFTFAIISYQLKKYNEMFAEFSSETGLSQIEIDVLAFLANNPEYVHAKDIVEKRGVSKSHVSIAVEKLVKKGYLNQKEDLDNRRRRTLCLTEKVKPLIDEIQAIQQEYKNIAYNGFSQKEKDLLNDFLTRIYRNLGGLSDERTA